MSLYDFYFQSYQGALRHWMGLIVPSERIFGLYILTMVVMAWFIWLSRRKQGLESRGFFAYTFDSKVYNHKSAWQDYIYFFANGFIFYGVIIQFLSTEQPFIAMAYNTLMKAFGSPSRPLLDGLPAKILFTITYALLYDLAVYLLHYAMHKISVLWPYHKIHHAAEVLTPITLFRMHPVDLLFNALAVTAFTGVGMGIFQYLAGHPISGMEVFGVNFVLFLFYFAGYNLRHSQIWLHYPKWLSHILISPAQHQIHHSTHPKHMDKNLGLIFSFWDKMFGTLYVPEGYEDLEYGVNRKERNPYASVTSMFVKPFVESFAAFRVLMTKASLKESLTILAAFAVSFVMIRGVSTLYASPDIMLPSVYMEELTWPEIHTAVAQGYTTVIVPSGGTEQNGPHMVLGKHNVIVHYTAGEMAKRLGKTLVAPVIAYVPEGDIGPPSTLNMQWDGTIGVPDRVLEEVLYWAAVSLRKQGFKYIFLVGDHRLDQEPEQSVAQKLASWQKDGVTVAFIGDYFFANGQIEWLKQKGFSEKDIGFHAGIRDTSEMMYLQPEGIRQNPVAIPGMPDGVIGDPSKASAEFGKKMIELKIAAGVAQMRQVRDIGVQQQELSPPKASE